MFVASFWLMPTTPDLEMRSEPARSTKRKARFADLPAPSTCVQLTRTRQCERDERSLRLWPAAERSDSTRRASLATSAGALIGIWVSPSVPNAS